MHIKELIRTGSWWEIKDKPVPTTFQITGGAWGPYVCIDLYIGDRTSAEPEQLIMIDRHLERDIEAGRITAIIEPDV